LYLRDRTVVRECPIQLEAGLMARATPGAGAGAGRLVRYIRKHPQTSYWEGEAKEMVAINAILIIVNSVVPQSLSKPRSSRSGGSIEARFCQK
jgi:hypothetical protein